jgi:hypothetical protein
MAHLELHKADGGYRVHRADGTVEPDIYVSYHCAASRVRWLNLTTPVAAPAAPARKRRGLLLRRTR